MNIFRSNLTLNYINILYESSYFEKKLNANKKYTKYYTVLIFLIFLCLMLHFIISDHTDNDRTCFFYYLSISMSSAYFFFIIGLILRIDGKLILAINYLNYFIFPISCIALRHILIYKKVINYIDYTYLVLLFENFFRLTWLMFWLCDFIDTTILNFFMFLVLILIYLPYDNTTNYFVIYYYLFSFFIISLISYFFIKYKKISYFYECMQKMKYEQLKDLLENMSFGFICVKNSEISYINKTMVETLDKCDDYVKVVTDKTIITTESESSKHNVYLLDYLLKNLTITKNDQDVNINFNLSDMNNDHIFKFIGYVKFKQFNSDLIFEVLCRRVDELDNYHYEFILNNVTQVKISTENRTEKKYKSIFLSKVAHEFKNPIISIQEIIVQIKNIISRKDSSNINLSSTSAKDETNLLENLIDDVRAISDYLLLIVKDLNYFSKKESGTSITFNRTICNLRHIISFVERVTINIIKKYNKFAVIRFNVIIEKDVPKSLYSDEDCLKQIILNLLTNSIKHTYEGYIKLIVSMEYNMVKFSIIDTGIGIKKEQIPNIFLPKGNQIGMSIVYDLTSNLGKTVEMETKEGMGSSFWFYIESNKYKRKKERELTEKPNKIFDINSCMSNESVYDNLSLTSEFSDKTVQINKIILSHPNEFFNKEYVKVFSTYDNLNICNHINLIIIVDDEKMTRQSMIRIFSEIANLKSIPLSIVEAEDGMECLYIVFICIKYGIKVSAIISDQTMNFLNGSDTVKLLKRYINNSLIIKIPFYIITAYEDENTLTILKESCPDNIFSKPLKKNIAENIIMKI